jgi:hypothetical protein
MEFDEEVEQAIKDQVPVFYRALARKGLEDFAKEKGVDRVTIEIFNEAKAKYLGGTM